MSEFSSAEHVRLSALDFAMRLEPSTAAELVGDAKIIEDYLASAEPAESTTVINISSELGDPKAFAKAVRDALKVLDRYKGLV